MRKINLTPIIDVVFILLIFFMLATNFQDFSQTDIELSSESSQSISSDKKMYVISVDKDKNYKLNDNKIHVNDIKAKVLTSIRSKEEHMVILKPDDDVNMQIILSVMEDFNNSKISNMLLGIKDNTDDDEKYYDPTSRKSKAGVILGKPVQ
ncbi:MAG: hypothetical protein CMD82_00280 [Gammaproteobacteria bacterium]|nr:hypothetical protein [Gammaproteobacteria bacterium]